MKEKKSKLIAGLESLLSSVALSTTEKNTKSHNLLRAFT